MTKIETEQNQGDFALPAVRRAEMLRMVKQFGQITVTEMSARFEVSLDTIRRDLDILADQGLISRTHGGAMPIDGMASADSPFEQRINAHQVAKTNIGRAAANLAAQQIKAAYRTGRNGAGQADIVRHDREALQVA